jgi:hypothetical protein
MDVATISGLTSQVGYELRVPFNSATYDDQFLFGLGVGYEYLVFSPKDASFSSTSGGGFRPAGEVRVEANGRGVGRDRPEPRRRGCDVVAVAYSGLIRGSIPTALGG